MVHDKINHLPRVASAPSSDIGGRPDFALLTIKLTLQSEKLASRVQGYCRVIEFFNSFLDSYKFISCSGIVRMEKMGN
jgi:hypothetical protein